MRFGNWRGVTLALALGSALATITTTTAFADLFHHDIPRLVPAVDVNTGGPYYAPPVPYGHYAGKDIPGHLSKAFGGLFGMLHGCGDCGGGHGSDCGTCGGSGCGFCKGRGLFGHGHGGDACGEKGCGLFKGHGHKAHGASLCGDNGCGSPAGFASTGVLGSSQQVVVSSPQAPMSSAQCGEAGCGLKGHHRHLRGGHGDGGCGQCGGKGCGACGGGGMGNPCGGCGGKGCGLCSKAKSLLNAPHSLLGALLHKNKIKYFVGPGGPVPITPGYVPYVITTRSPRDFLAFPPFTP